MCKQYLSEIGLQHIVNFMTVRITTVKILSFQYIVVNLRSVKKVAQATADVQSVLVLVRMPSDEDAIVWQPSQ